MHEIIVVLFFVCFFAVVVGSVEMLFSLTLPKYVTVTEA